MFPHMCMKHFRPAFPYLFYLPTGWGEVPPNTPTSAHWYKNGDPIPVFFVCFTWRKKTTRKQADVVFHPDHSWRGCIIRQRPIKDPYTVGISSGQGKSSCHLRTVVCFSGVLHGFRPNITLGSVVRVECSWVRCKNTNKKNKTICKPVILSSVHYIDFVERKD